MLKNELRFFSLIGVGLLLSISAFNSFEIVHADEESSPTVGKDQSSENSNSGDSGDSGDSEESAAPKKNSRNKRGYTVGKETEGTTAPNRFQADTVIKSQYKFEGEQLEVDPD